MLWELFCRGPPWLRDFKEVRRLIEETCLIGVGFN